MKKLLFTLLAIASLPLGAAAAPKIPADRFAGAFAHPRAASIHLELKAEVDAEPDPQTVGGHNVALSWTAPVIPAGSSCVVSSYNVKRGTSSGAETTIQNVSGTTYTDTGVSAGQKLFYEVTAVSTVTTCQGESAPSNELALTIPLDTLPAPTGLNGTPK